MEGWLEKRGRRFNTSFQRRYFRSVEDEDGSLYLLYYKAEKNDARPRGSLLLWSPPPPEGQAAPPPPFTAKAVGHRELDVATPDRVLHVRAPSPEARNQWMEYLAGIHAPPKKGAEEARRASVLDPAAVVSLHNFDADYAEEEEAAAAGRPLGADAVEGAGPREEEDDDGFGYYGSYAGFDADAYDGEHDVAAPEDGDAAGPEAYDAVVAAAAAAATASGTPAEAAELAAEAAVPPSKTTGDHPGAEERRAAIQNFYSGRRSANADANGRAAMAAAAAAKGDFNSRWVALHSLEPRVLEDQVEYGRVLKGLQEEFSAEVERTARLIIAEARLPAAERTLKPADVGGVAGGVKVVHNSVLYKFALDDRGLYGGDEFAMKAASNELRSLDAVYNTRTVHPFITPLTATVDWLGFRVTASTLVPVSADTIVYGSADGGRTVVSVDALAAGGMEALAGALNLKPHVCDGVLMSGPADIEVHRGRDGVLYVLDAARLFPPSAPLPNIRNAWLYRLLRPEAVRSSHAPLSSDAFSRFGRDGAAVHNAEVREATVQLLRYRLAAVASALDSRRTEDDFHSPVGRELHESGINCRHLGLLRTRLRSQLSRRVVLEDMVARALKFEFRSAMRRLVRDCRGLPAAAFEEAVRARAARVLNVLFGRAAPHGAAADSYWRGGGRLCRALSAKFLVGLTEEERSPGADLRDGVDMARVFARFLADAGLALRGVADAEAAPSAFEAADVTETRARVRSLGAVPLAEAIALTSRAKQAVDAESAEQLRGMALAKFEEASRSSPNSLQVCQNFAAFLQTDMGDVARAEAIHERAAALNPRNADVLGNVAQFHQTVSRRLDRAAEYYERATDADPTHLSNVCNRASFVHSVLQRPDDPWLLRVKAEGLSLSETDPRAIGNAAGVVWEVFGDAERADEMFRLSVKRNARDPLCLNGYARFLSGARGDHAAAARLYEAALVTQPDNVFSLAYLGRLRALYLGDPVEGERLMRAAVAAHPRNANALLNLAETLYALGRVADSEPVFRALLDLQPADDKALEYLTHAAEAGGRPGEAEEFHRRRVAGAGAPAWAHMNYGQFILRVRPSDVAAAEPHYARAGQMAEEARAAGGKVDGNLHYNWANHLAKTGRVEEALRQYAVSAEAGEPAGGLAKINAAVLCCNMGRVAEAVRMSGEVLDEVDPGSQRALSVLLQIKLATEGLPAGLAVLDAAIERTGGRHRTPLWLKGRMLLHHAQQNQAGLELLERARACDNPEERDQVVPALLGDVGLARLLLANEAKAAGNPAEAEHLAGAIEALVQTTSMAPSGEHLYNLACALCRRAAPGDAAGVRNALEQGKAAHGMPPAAHIAADDDLAPVRGEEWFQALLR